MLELKEGARVEADDCYVREAPQYVKYPMIFATVISGKSKGGRELMKKIEWKLVLMKKIAGISRLISFF